MSQEQNGQEPNGEPQPATPEIIEESADTNTQKAEPPKASQEVHRFTDEPPKAKREYMMKYITSIDTKYTKDTKGRVDKKTKSKE